MAGADDGADAEKESLGDRIRHAFLKPAVEGETKPAPFDELTTVDEIQGAIRRADDTERLVGLIAAPLAGAVALVVTSSLIGSHPKDHSVYLEVGAVAMILALLTLAFAWWRKRLYMGITMALYGLSVFNLKFWGFGVPFVLVGAWYLVRAYRLQAKLKTAQAAAGPTRPVSGPGPASNPNKRYTPKTAPPGRNPKQNGKQRRAG